MRRYLISCALLLLAFTGGASTAQANESQTSTCDPSFDGGAINCNGTYVIHEPGWAASHAAHPGGVPPAHAKGPPLGWWVILSPTNSCEIQGTPTPPLMVIVVVAGTPGAPSCPKPAPAAANPTTLAQQFWQTIDLPVPRPSIPPGYAITGKQAYLVTQGTTHPAPFVRQTPVGRLTVTAVGSYVVNWGDGSSPTWTGPYDEEGQPWPNGQIIHTFDDAGYFNVQVVENWTATWTLAGQTGHLAGLRTSASVRHFHAEQVEAINVN